MPAISPMRSVSSVPVVMTANRLRPCLSLPKGSAQDGGCSTRAESGLAFCGSTSSPPINAKAIRPRSKANPTVSDLLRRR